ncbi:MAG: peptidoglycan DD-metalloendopeptidase family protein [Lachnospiraceae bacterium]
MKKVNWKRIMSDRTILTALLLGLAFLTAVTVSVVVHQRGSQKKNDLVAQESMEENAKYDVDESSPNELAVVPNDESASDENAQEANADSVEASSDENVEVAAIGNALAFSEESTLTWPVQGEVIREYSMDHTTWYATLEQYRTSPAIVIQAEVGQAVVAPANSQVIRVGYNEEIGNYVVMDIGSEYSVLIGALDNICVVSDQYVTAGTQIATVAQPTIYYSVEGPSIYFEVLNGTEPSDPLDYME